MLAVAAVTAMLAGWAAPAAPMGTPAVLTGAAIAAPHTFALAPAWSALQQYRFVKRSRTEPAQPLVWFNGRPGDLEVPAFFRKGLLYISLTDLIRHLGGQVIWHPRCRLIEVRRRGVTILLRQNTDAIVVNGVEVSLPGKTVVVKGRTCVPLARLCQLLGVACIWNKQEGHADVYFAE